MKPIISMYRNTLNPDRQLLPGGYMEYMSFKTITPDELNELMCNLDFNPTHCYPAELECRNNEVGHDQLYRYILKEQL